MVFLSFPVRPFIRDSNPGALIFFASCSSPCRGTTDLFTFLIILVTIRGPRTSRFPGVPSILDAILRDATVYFLLMTIAQLLLFASTLFAPVGDPYHIEGRWSCCAHRSCTFQVQTRTLPGMYVFSSFESEATFE